MGSEKSQGKEEYLLLVDILPLSDGLHRGATSQGGARCCT